MSGAGEKKKRSFIGIGSNLGDRLWYIRAALKAMEESPGLDVLACSQVADTRPVDNLDQPHFLNQVVSVDTSLSPHGLLTILQAIETNLGRKRTVWKGPRTIDLDILLYGDRVVGHPSLTIPHAQLLNRLFLVRQILEIDPDAVDPASHQTLVSFLRREQNS